MDGEQPSIAQPKHCRCESIGWIQQIRKTVTGLINPKDNEASEMKAEQLALDSSSGLAHFSKMGACSYTLPSVFEPPSDSKPGPEGESGGSLRTYCSQSTCCQATGNNKQEYLRPLQWMHESICRRSRRQAQDPEARGVSRHGNQGQGAQAGAFIPTCPTRNTLRP